MSSKLTLEEVKAEFERWRAERKNSRQAIPQYLWKLVKQLTGRYKSTEITRALRVRCEFLFCIKNQMDIVIMQSK